MTPSPPPEPDEKGWIAHDGSGCPVDMETIVSVRFRKRHPNDRSDHSTTSVRAGFWANVGTDWWRHRSPCRDNDIIAYRVVSK